LFAFLCSYCHSSAGGTAYAQSVPGEASTTADKSAVARRNSAKTAANNFDSKVVLKDVGRIEAAPEPTLSALEAKLESMEALLRAQNERIAALESALRAVRTAAAVAAPADPSAEFASASAAQEEVNQGGEPQVMKGGPPKQSNEDRWKRLGPFSFSGDLRLRAEPSFGGPADHSQQRMRERIRLRFNVDAQLNDEVKGGFSLASGDLNNPISTNQTTNQFYTRKPFDVDRAFVTYNPHYFKALTLTGGKFSYPWYNTEMIWDKDLNPEGVAQTLAWNFNQSPVVKRLAFVGFELPFTETAGVALKNKSIVESIVYGGQVQTKWQLADWLRLSAYAGYYDWHLADPIALAVAQANSAGPEFGLLKLNSNSNQNSVTTTTGTLIATAQQVITNAQFASKFGLFDSIARFDIKTPAPRWPVVILGDFVQNTKACANVSNILPAPANSAVETFAQSRNAICDPRQRRGYWLEADVGSTEEKGDWEFGYTRTFIEREAVLGVFNYSEMRQGSNLTSHRVEVLYQAYKNVQLNFIGLFGRPLVTAGSPAPAESFVKRLQFDVVYKF
jgi:hypothetical protein